MESEMTLYDIIEKVESLPWNYMLYAEGPELTAATSCLVLCDVSRLPLTEDVGPGGVHPEAARRGFELVIDIGTVQDMCRGYRELDEGVEVEWLIRALNHYLEYDAWLQMD